MFNEVCEIASSNLCHDQAKRPARKAKELDEDGYTLSKFYPLLQVHLRLTRFIVVGCSYDVDTNCASFFFYYRQFY